MYSLPSALALDVTQSLITMSMKAHHYICPVCVCVCVCVWMARREESKKQNKTFPAAEDYGSCEDVPDWLL